VSPEDRAKAVVAYFPAIPEKIRRQLETVITRASKRALHQQLGELEQIAAASAEYAMGRGKNGKGRDDDVMRCHDDWANRFRRMRNGTYAK
jgi:hypothetical protein